MAANVEPLDAEKARVDFNGRELAIKVEKEQQLLPERQRLSQTASHSLAQSEDILRDQQLMFTAMTAE